MFVSLLPKSLFELKSLLAGKLLLTLALVVLSGFHSRLNAQPVCEVIDYKTTVSISGSELVTETYLLIKVNNPAGAWITDFSLPYQKGDRLEILYGRIYDNNGNIVRKLRKEEIEKANDISYSAFYQDVFKKEFSLHWNEYPFLVELSYRESEDKYIFLSRWSPYSFSGIPVRHASLTFMTPVDMKATVFNADSLDFEDASTDKATIYRWSAENLPAIKPEYYAVPSFETAPRITIVPEEFIYGNKGSAESWQSFGLWVDGLIKDLDLLPPEEKEKVSRMLVGVSGNKEKVNILYHYLQENTHYINISVEIGGYKPYPASYVSANKYGDCKALTVYMKALLKEAGIDSFFSLIYAGENPILIDRTIPGSQFNHVILCVPLEGDTIWLENTANYTPTGYLGTFTQGRYALVVNGNNSRLVKTPSLSEQDVSEISTYRFRLNESGSGQCSITKTLRGESFERFSGYRTYLSDKDIHDKIAGSLPFSNFELTGWEFGENDRNESSLGLSCTLNIRNLIRTVGNNLIITPSVYNLPQFEEPSARTRPVRIPYPYSETDTMYFSNVFINKYSISLPDRVNLSTKYGSFELSATNTDNTVCVVKRLILERGEYTTDEYESFYRFISSIKDSMKKFHIIYNRMK